MLWHLICLLGAAATLWQWPAPISAYVAPISGCHHNGSWYADKSLVPTMEKCLNCQCNKKTLVCRLKVCPEMPMPPPRSCVVVQKKNTCCPYLSCARLEAFYKIPLTRRIIQYLDHYERESIDRVVKENMLQRRSDDSDTELHVCVKNGTVYKSGSAMSSSNLCSYCYCIGGSEKCVKPKCMLPVEGCKPIFVDSTCCPVRYDCSAKTSGKSSQEIRYRITSNKHFLRMSQRLQRNRGCSVGKQFYAEGQKMKSDVDKPCDICFCIRGQRRCAPKKCSPALKNCIPVVPKGQCCPSSYDCDSQRDYRRSHNSRQFNLFSLIFGRDANESDSNAELPTTEISVQYPHDRQPPNGSTQGVSVSSPSSSSEKSIFDTIREGLEFIDVNNDKLLEENIDLIPAEDASVIGLPPPPSTSTEVSFLDLLLGSGDILKDDTSKLKATSTEEKTTTTDADNDISWVDLLLGEEEKLKKGTDTTVSLKLDSTEATTNDQLDFGTTYVDRVGDASEEFSGDGVTMITDDIEKPNAENPPSNFMIESTTMPTTTTITFKPLKPIFRPILQNHLKTSNSNNLKVKTALNKTESVTSTTHPSTDVKQKPIEQLYEKTNQPLKNDDKVNQTNQTTTQNSNLLLSAFLDGISSALDAKTNSAINSITTVPTTAATTTTKILKTTTQKSVKHPIVLPTPRPLPQFKPLPLSKPHTRINSKLANLTTNPLLITTKLSENSTNLKFMSPMHSKVPLQSQLQHSKTTTKSKATTNPISLKTSATVETTTMLPPLVISTNPTILEAEPLDNVSELPPSLPNLEIIPFLPTDAVKTDRNQTAKTPLYGEYYNSLQQTPHLDFDPYVEDSIYPPITERYPSFGDEFDDGTKAEYLYKFNVEGPVITPVAATLDPAPAIKYGMAGDVTEVELEVDMPTNQGFSPPNKTEGGFVPKKTFIIGVDGELHENITLDDTFKQQVTERIIDITTVEPLAENTVKIIALSEFTTPDPFKDVIRTEPPPDLTSSYGRNPVADNKTQVALVNSDSQDHRTTAFSKVPFTNDNTTDLKSHDIAKKKQTVTSLLDLLFKDDGPGNLLNTVPLLNSSLEASSISRNISSTTIKTPIAKISTKPTPPKTNDKTTSKVTAPRPTAIAKRPISTKTSHKHQVKPSRPSNTVTAAVTRTAPTKSKMNSTTVTTTSKTTTQKPITHKSTIINIATTTTKPTPSSTIVTSDNNEALLGSTSHPFLLSPFDKLPFMDTSYEVRPFPVAAIGEEAASAANIPQNEVDNANNYLNLWHFKTTLNQPTSSATITTTTAPMPQALFVHHSQQQQHTTTTSNLIDPMGLLKLAGCNIYGRMYRVGRIILELSSACLECKCTEVGVKCGPLDC